ncbi:MAG: ATP-binding protein [Alphaproteobacteria bacterium]
MADGGSGDRSYLIAMALGGAASGVAVTLGAWAFGALSLWQSGVAVGAALLIGFLVSRPWAQDIQELTERARSIGDEDVESQPMARRTAIGVALARALIESRRRVHSMQRALEERAVTGEQVLDAAPEPLFVIDLKQAISHANQAAERAFGQGLLGRPMVDVVRVPELLDAVDAVVTAEQTEAMVDFEVGDRNERSYRAIVGRLETMGGGGEVAVIALQDLTAIRQVEAMRADFVANASHELRTPLASLVGFIETLEGPAKGDPEAQGRFLRIMREQASRMSLVVEDLLSLSRIEMEEHTPPGETNSVATVIRSVIDQLEPVAEARSIDVRCEVADDMPAVSGNSDLLQQVFRNLLENAIKYGQDGGVVTITGISREESVLIAFADDGVGIPAEHIPRLTERFYRVDAARSRSLGGTGLGLAIVKHIMNRCRGSLTISSQVGEGSVFTVHLPPPMG